MPKLLTTLIVSLTLITSPAYAEHGYNRDRGHRDHGHHEHYKHHSHDKHDNDNSSVWAGVALIFTCLVCITLPARRKAQAVNVAVVKPNQC